ncbi:MAG: ABC transporter substrate-binding protein [Halanaerobiales bacterium]
MVITGKKTMLVIGLVLLALVFNVNIIQAEEFSIGISQIVEHPALDSAKEGFIEGLAEEGFKEGEILSINQENAQGEFSNAQSIAEKFKKDDHDLVLAIATPCAQATANVIKDTPVLFTAVTDPVSAGLVDSMEDPGGNISGTTDMNPVEEQFALIKEVVPDVETVGIIYNSGEDNSKVQVEIAEEVSEKMDIELKEGTATNTGEVQLAASSLVDKVDAIYLPTDNVVASAIASILKVTDDKKVPVFGSEEAMVEEGAVATRGINYFELGRKTGQMAAEVLKGKAPSEINVEGSDSFDLVINEKTSENLDMTIPDELIENADNVIE